MTGFLINFTIKILVTLISCTGAALIGRQLILKKNNLTKTKNSILKICAIVIKLFLRWHIPLLILLTIFSIIDMFSQMLAIVIIAGFAIVVERLIEHTNYENSFSAPPCFEINSNAEVFAYIDLYRKAAEINHGLIQRLSMSQSDMLAQIKTTNKETSDILLHINSYAQLQHSECEKLLEKKNEIDQFFDDLSQKTEKFCDTFKQYENKLSGSSNALFYYEESALLMDDLKESFQSKFKQSSNDFIKRINDVEGLLLKIVDEYAKLGNFILPQMQKVSVYNARMDSVLESFKNGIVSKQTLLENTSKEISGTLVNTNKNMSETLEYLNQYLEKNTFVLSKILDAYRQNVLTPRKLRKLIKNWPEPHT